MDESRFRIGPEIVHETVDDEVIAIDLANGSYYSLAGSGPAIWELLTYGASKAEIGEALATRYEADAETIAADVSALIAQLVESELAVAVEDEDDGPPPAIDGNGDRRAFEAARFERYTDMQDYFLLDPIHEVDTAGWPRPAA